MADYITRPGGHDATYQGPYTATGVSMRLYILPANPVALQTTLDGYVNKVAPAGRRYVPLGDRIVACFAAMGSVVGANATLGFMREIDVGFFVPAVRFDNLLPTKIGFFAPYLFVDIPQAVVTGREVHGYRKDLGTSFSAIDTFADAWMPDAADLTRVEAWSVSAPGARLRRTRLVDVGSPAGPLVPVPWANPAAALADVLGALMGTVQPPPTLTANLAQLSGNLLGPLELVLPIVFLRQFRDPRNSKNADTQSVLEANTRVPLATLAGGKLTGNFTVTFFDTASHPLGSELGVGSGAPVASSLTIALTCAFVLEHAT